MSEAADKLIELAAAHEQRKSYGVTDWRKTDIRPMPAVSSLAPEQLRAELRVAERCLRTISYTTSARRLEFWTKRVQELCARIEALPPPKLYVVKDPVIPKHKPERVIGNGGAKRTIPFETVQECRRLHEQEHMSGAEIARKFSLEAATVRQWLDYETRAKR